MMEDAMLVYRLVRSPERRIFYVDVSAIHPNDVPSYMEAVKESMRGASVIEQAQGRQDFRYNPLPVHKDTMIPLLDGRTITIENLAAEFNTGKTNWVYSVQDKTNKIVAGKVVWCGKNYTAEKLIKVTLDDGTWIKTAPEHPFVLRDGTSCRADELKPEMSLMPLYTKLSGDADGLRIKKYPMVYDPHSGTYKFVHRVVSNEVLSEQRELVRKHTDWNINNNLTVHHKDCNRLNANPDNLEWMGNVDHIKEHSITGTERLMRYNKSEKKRTQTSADNRKYRKAELMNIAYNGSLLHKTHNVIRREAQLNSWASNKESRSAVMRYAIPQICEDMAVQLILSDKKLTRDRVAELLLANPAFVEALKEANRQTKRGDKLPKPRTLAESISHTAGHSSFSSFKESVCGYANHKVSKVETIEETADVYCMTVTGPHGEDDRHNFGVSTTSTTSGLEDWNPSGVFLKNSVDEDYFLPTRPNSQTKIENIAGGQNTTATEDVEYILKKLIAALMVPKAYLTYDEAISSKATLAQEDIRFSRTVATLQKIVIAELNKLATIHLYALGFSGNDLINFELKFSNPSTVAVQQKLALVSSKVEIAGKAWEIAKETGLLSMNYIQTEILGLRPEEINTIKQESRQDQVFMAELKKIAENPPFDRSVDSNIDIFDKQNYKVPTSPFAPEKKELTDLERQNHEEEKEYQERRAKEREEKGSTSRGGVPISFSPTPNLDKSFRKRDRSKEFTGNRALSLPDFGKMLSAKNRYAQDPFDMEGLGKTKKFVLEDEQIQKELLGETGHIVPLRGMPRELQTSLRSMNEAFFKREVEISGIDIISEEKQPEVIDELFDIEAELKSTE
jgi:hypothetical protein